MNALENITERGGLPSQGIRMFTREELRFIFKVGDSTVDEWQTQGGLPFFKKGRVVRYPAAEVCAWVRSRTMNGRTLATDCTPASAKEVEQFWGYVERMVCVVVHQTMDRLEHPNHLEAA